MSHLKHILFLCVPICAFATLGQNFTSIAEDAARMGIPGNTAELQTLIIESTAIYSASTYSIYQMTSMNGVEIKEYVANDKVFAVVWQGESEPNLSQLFGKFFHVYENATPKYKSSTLESIQGDNFISYFGNLSGHVSGKAIVPSLMPEGLNMTKIK